MQQNANCLFQNSGCSLPKMSFFYVLRFSCLLSLRFIETNLIVRKLCNSLQSLCVLLLLISITILSENKTGITNLIRSLSLEAITRNCCSTFLDRKWNFSHYCDYFLLKINLTSRFVRKYSKIRWIYVISLEFLFFFLLHSFWYGTLLLDQIVAKFVGRWKMLPFIPVVSLSQSPLCLLKPG